MVAIRNVAIIAHVDHGKTTLVNSILKQTNIFRENQVVADRIMDSGALEQERGITILAKCTSLFYKDVKFNIVDTPGHADFGGEVERVLSMVEGVILLVDSSEGVMPQTRFVLGKALALGLRVIVLINKVDRKDRRCEEVKDQIEGLFLDLNATNDQLDFKTLYSVGCDGWAVDSYDEAMKILAGQATGDLAPLLDLIIDYFPSPSGDATKPFEMLTSILSSDNFLGKILIGKVYNGIARVNTPVKVMDLSGNVKEKTKLTKMFSFRGIDRYPIDEIVAGDIVAIAGVETAFVSDTICDPNINDPIKTTPVDPPTMSISIGVNDSPFGGKEGKKVTSQQILERLKAEAATNVAITVTVDSHNDCFDVGGRGELQLGVLIEQMRREDFELSVGRPRVLFKKDEATGERLEPIEEVVIDVDDKYSGVIMQKLSQRKGEVVDMRPLGVDGKTRMIFYVPSRCLIGYQAEFRNDTHGDGVMNHVFYKYAPYKGDMGEQRNGVLVSMNTGKTTAYALQGLQERAVLFVGPGVDVYEGMIVGENSRIEDLKVNPTRPKAMSNMRSATSEETVALSPPRVMTLEEMMSYISDNEVVEVTPKHIRLRKKDLKKR